MDWIVFPQNLTVLGNTSLKEVTKVRWGHRGGALIQEDRCLIWAGDTRRVAQREGTVRSQRVGPHQKPAQVWCWSPQSAFCYGHPSWLIQSLRILFFLRDIFWRARNRQSERKAARSKRTPSLHCGQPMTQCRKAWNPASAPQWTVDGAVWLWGGGALELPEPEIHRVGMPVSRCLLTGSFKCLSFCSYTYIYIYVCSWKLVPKLIKP